MDLSEFSLIEAYRLPGRIKKLMIEGNTIYSAVQARTRSIIYFITPPHSSPIFSAQGFYKIMGKCKDNIVLIYTENNGDNIVFIKPTGRSSIKKIDTIKNTYSLSGRYIFFFSRKRFIHYNLYAMNCKGEILAVRDLEAIPQEIVSNGDLVSLSTTKGHYTYKLANSDFEEIYRDNESINNEIRLFLIGREHISVRRGEVKSLNRGWSTGVPFDNPHVTPFGDTILVWEPAHPNIIRLNTKTGATIWNLSFNPILGVLTGENLIQIFLRKKLLTLSGSGSITDIVFLPVPKIEEAIIKDEKLIFTLMNWVGIAKKQTITPEIRAFRLKKFGEEPKLEAEVIVSTPSGGEILKEAVVTINNSSLKSTSETQQYSPGQSGSTTIVVPTTPGENNIQITVRQTIDIAGRKYTLESTMNYKLSLPSKITEPPNLLGKFLGDRYRIWEFLGRGGFAATYKARDINTDRLVAVKVFNPIFGDITPLTMEAYHAAKAAERANRAEKVVVEILDMGKYSVSGNLANKNNESEVYALIQEYVDGGSLRSLIEGDFSLKQRIAVSAKIAHKLALLHDSGIVHGDIKPENILLYATMDPVFADLYTVVILDKFQEARKLLTYALTPAYAPPELIENGIYSKKGDVYSLAVTIIETITGVLPRPPNIPVTLLKHNLPEETVRTLSKAISKKPRERPNSRQLQDALEKAMKKI